MKRWLRYGLWIVLLAALGFAPFRGTDVAKLNPVELIRASKNGGYILVETDGGDFGVGEDAPSAFADLKQKAAGEIFLETADYLLIAPELSDQIFEFGKYLRPACAVCLEYGEADLEKAVAFLKTHKPETSILDIRGGETRYPSLMVWEERMLLVQ